MTRHDGAPSARSPAAGKCCDSHQSKKTVGHMSIHHALQLVDAFLNGDDVSKHQASEIELALETLTERPAIVEETLTMLASYQPGGGEFLFDLAAMESQLRLLRRYLAGAS